MAYDYLKLSETQWEDALYEFFGIGSEIASKIRTAASNRGLTSYYFNCPYNKTAAEPDFSVPFGKQYVLQKLNHKITAIFNQFSNFEKAQEAFDAANVDGVVSLETTESGTENGTNAVTAHDATSGTGTNKSTFSPINSAYEKTSDKTETDTSATNDRTQTTTDEKTTSKTTTRQEYHGSGTPLETVSAAYMALSPIDKFLNALEMILLTPEEYYEIMEGAG